MRMTRPFGLAFAMVLWLAILAPPRAEIQNLPQLPAAVCDTLRAERAKYPAIIQTHEQLANILIATAWKHQEDGWGLSRKDFGQHNPDPRVGPIADDILHRNTDNMHWDVMGSAGVGFPSTISCSTALGPMTDSRRPWVAPVDIGAKQPPPPPPPPDCSVCQTTLTERTAELARVRSELTAEIAGLRDQLIQANEARNDLEGRNLQLLAQVADLQGQLNNVRCSWNWSKFACQRR